MYLHYFAALCFAAASCLWHDSGHAQIPDTDSLKTWVTQMKAAERGPFAQIRWFCKDGEILPPEPYACKPHGGGSQHGQWTDQVKKMRASGFMIASVYADLDVAAFTDTPDYQQLYGQMLIEAFLREADGGWIMRKAQFYRGAYQEEGERQGAKELLLRLVAIPDWLDSGFLALRIGSRLIAHGPETGSVSKVRQLASSLAGVDPGFKTLRNKIHVAPGHGDAQRVRDYIQGKAGIGENSDYHKLAAAIDAVYSTVPAFRARADRHRAGLNWLFGTVVSISCIIYHCCPVNFQSQHIWL